MTDISSFVKLSPRETVIDDWEVVADTGKPTLVEIIVGAVIGIVLFSFVYSAIWVMFSRVLDYEFIGLANFFVLLLSLAVPGGLIAWPMLSRPPVHGHLCLTNWRLLYYAQGQGRFQSMFSVKAVNLADVLGIHTIYTEGIFGKKMLEIIVYTRFHDGIKIEMGVGGSALGRLPLLGKFMVRSTLGKDAFAMLPILYRRIRQNTGAAASTNLIY